MGNNFGNLSLGTLIKKFVALTLVRQSCGSRFVSNLYFLICFVVASNFFVYIYGNSTFKINDKVKV